MRRNQYFAILITVLFLLGTAIAQDISSFEKRVTVKTLANGLTVIVMERPEAPVFSFYTMVNTGASQDPQGASGLAHMFEHMAFKGSAKIGTKDYAKEKAALDKMEAAFQAFDHERLKANGRDLVKQAQLEKTWKDAMQEAQEYVKENEFDEIISSHGAVGSNAGTTMDETVYYYSMPANQVELWAYMESDRFIHPVFREFYKERDVVVEERRMRTDSQPIGRLVEQMLYAAYTVHPYHRPAVGPMSEIQNVTVTEAEKFFKKYYVPSNMTISIVGDVKAKDVLPIIQAYYGRIPKGTPPPEENSVEPAQRGERRVTLREPGNPWYVEAYHRPDYHDPDDAVYDAITDLMSNGRNNRIYRSLVRDKQVALAAGGFSGLPGTKYPSLFVFYAIPNQGKTVEQCAGAIRAEIERLKNEDISDDELQSLKTRAKANLIRSLGSNDGLAQLLATYQTRYGDWREIFHEVEKIEKVSKADIRRVAAKAFTEGNRTVGTVEPPVQGAQKGGN